MFDDYLMYTTNYSYKFKPVAIKVIKPENATKAKKQDKLLTLNSEGKYKFEREVEVHSRARNDNIVKVWYFLIKKNYVREVGKSYEGSQF